MSSWWERDPKRLLREVAALDALAKEDPAFVLERPLFKNGEMIIQGTFKLNGVDKKFFVTYPDLFPLVCPSVKPQEKERWSAHQYGDGGTLCLEIGPDNWDQSKFTGRDFLVSLKNLVVGETKNGEEDPPEVPSRHEETEGQRLRGSYFRFVIPDTGLVSEGMASHGTCVVTSNVVSDTGIMWINEFPKGTMVTVPHGLKHGASFNRDVKYFVLKNPWMPLKAKEFVAVPKLVRFLIADQLGEDQAKAFDGLEDGMFSLFLFEGSEPLLLRTSKADDELRLKVVPSTQFEHKDRTDPKTLEAFEKIKVSIVGLGSVGSKIAVSLARIGVRDFVLVDDEILEFGNIVRHEATLADVSAHKVDMVADLIHHICPVEPTIKRERIRIGGQENAARYAEMIRSLLSADVVIDCTASGDVFQVLSALCSRNKKPLIWGEVFAGGIGGLVGSADPKNTPSPILVKRALLDYLSVQPDAPYKHETERYQGGPLIADDNSVAVIANMMVYRTKQLVLNQFDPTEPPVWIVGLAKIWIFESCFEVKRIPCRIEDYPEEIGWGIVEQDATLSPDELKKFEKILGTSKVLENAN